MIFDSSAMSACTLGSYHQSRNLMHFVTTTPCSSLYVFTAIHTPFWANHVRDCLGYSQSSVPGSGTFLVTVRAMPDGEY